MGKAAFDLFSLAGQAALVTGATEGLGLEIVRGFAEAGARVYLNGREAARCARIAAGLCAEGLDVVPLAFDVSDGEAMNAVMNRISETDAGRLDILVNNVGMRARLPVSALSEETFRRVLDVNLSAAFFLSRSAARLMAAQRYGRIIMMSSITALRGLAGDAAYIASKGGLIAMTRALASEYGPDGITVNAIAPGPFRTAPNLALLASEDPASYPQIPLRRPGAPAEIVGPALLLASRASSYVTGQVLAVDGGQSTAL